MRVALVCDCFDDPGVEVILRSFYDLYKNATIYLSATSIDDYAWLRKANAKILKVHREPNLFTKIKRKQYFSNLKLKHYDLIISISNSEAKFIKKGTAKHICYCISPDRYYCQSYDDFLLNPGYGALNDAVSLFYKLIHDPFKRADLKAAQSPDCLVACSRYSAAQIKKFYKRESLVINPPILVPVENFSTTDFSTSNNDTIRQKSQEKNTATNKIINGKCQGYISATEQIIWKRLDLAVKSCIHLNEPLALIGDGPEHRRLKKLVGNNPLITFVPYASEATFKKYCQNSKAYISTGQETFDYFALKALSYHCPVIANRNSDLSDYIINQENGLFFETQSVASLAATLKKLRKLNYLKDETKNQYLPCSKVAFQQNFQKIIEQFFPKF